MSELLGLLEDALPYIGEAAQGEMGYGFFPGGDPRNFFPDDDATEQERANHKAACEAADRGEFNVKPDGEWVSPNMHVLKCQFGLGTYTFPNKSAADLYERIRAVVVKAANPPSMRRGVERE